MILMLALIFNSTFSLATDDPNELWLSPGGVRVIPVARGIPIRVGARGIIRVVDGDRSVRVVGLKAGTTILSAGPRAFRVHVTPDQQRDFIHDLRDLVETMRGLRLEFTSDRPLVTGTLLRFSDWQTIAEVARRHHGAYGFRARVMKDVGRAALRHLHEVARQRGYPLVRFEVDPEVTAVLPGSARTLRPSVESAMSAFGVGVTIAAEELEVQPLVRTRVILAEVSRGFEKTFGVRWPTEYTGQILPQPEVGNQLLAALRALEANGHAQVLAEPDLSCRSGGAARFHAGGEMPIRIASRREASVTWKRFGVQLDIRPRADHQGSISLDVKTEISTLDFAHAVDGVPALKSNVVESQFDLMGKRTVALAGLLRSESGESNDGLPLLSAVPLLGRLFSSRQFQNHRSELVIFVTPEIVKPEVDAKPVMPAGWSTDAD